MTTWTTGIVRVLAILVTVGCFVSTTADVCAQQTDPFPSSSLAPTDTSYMVDLNNDDLLVLEVRLERTSSGHGLLAYQHGDAVMMPLGEIASILELAIMVDVLTGSADGWIIDESRPFHLNLETGSVELGAGTIALPPSSVGNDDGDLYVRSDLLQQWLPIVLDINMARMNVTVTPCEVLPYQDRRRRDEQRAVWLSAHGRDEEAYPLWVAPYRMWSWPMTNATMALNSTDDGVQRRFSSQSWADIAGLSSNLFLTYVGTEEQSRTTARLKAGRWDPDGRLLGRAGATSYEFGDLDISRIPLISGSKRGFGFSLSNQDLNRSREFDNTDVRGDAPPGWEAELYINGTLYDFQKVGEDGRYVFEDVPMVVGNNNFRTMLYGPRGEKRTVMDYANISPEMIDVGELKYTATMIHEGSSLLTDETNGSLTPQRPWNQQLELAYAFSNRNALVLDLSSLSFGDQRNLYTSLTSHNSVGPVNVEGIVAASTDGGEAASLGARTTYLGQNILFQSSTNDAYRAESPDGVQYIRRQTVMQSSGHLMHRARRSLFYGLSTLDRQYLGRDLIRDQEYQFRLSGNQGKVLLSHTLRSRRLTYSDYRDDTLIGTFLMRTWVGPVSLRGDVSYMLGPSRVRSASATATAYRSDQLQATLRINHYLQSEFGNDGLNIEVTRLYDRFTLGANLNWYEDIGTTFGITVGTFLARDHRSNTWASTHRRMANRSAASVRTYIDLDSDGVYDNYDLPLEDVGFLNLTAWRDIRTNENGIALLPGVVAHRPQTIELDLATVDDPFLIPVSKGANVLGHPGGIVDVELAFAYAGEIEGSVVDADQPDALLRHVGLELLNRDGERMHSTVAEFDGFYYFSGVMPGTYELLVIPSTMNSRIYEIPDPVTVIVPGRGGYVAGPDIVLRRKKPVRSPVMATAVVLQSDNGEYPPTSDLAADSESVGGLVDDGETASLSREAPVAIRPDKSGPDMQQPLRVPLRLPRDRNCTGK